MKSHLYSRDRGPLNGFSNYRVAACGLLYTTWDSTVIMHTSRAADPRSDRQYLCRRCARAMATTIEAYARQLAGAA